MTEKSMAWNEPGGGRKPQDPWGNRGRNSSGNGLDDVLRKISDTRWIL